MKTNFFFLILSLNFICSCQSPTPSQEDKTILSIAPYIDQKDSLNNKIIVALTNFLTTKDSSLIENEYWEQSDFTNYPFPYLDLYRLSPIYTPTLLEITATDSTDQKIIKLAYIAHLEKENENHLNNIYNLIATHKDGKILFSNYLNRSTKNWQRLNRGSISYLISPNKKISEEEIRQQQKDIQKLCQFFNTSPIPLLYYSCTDPVEIFRIRGFDYSPNMYIAPQGGIVYGGNQVFAGNNKEIYTHEITHIYSGTSFPQIPILLNEGIATLFGGSGQHDYAWHKNNLKKYIQANPTNFNPTQHLSPYTHVYINKETSIGYMIGALICERTLRLYGKEKLFELFKQQGEIYTILSHCNLNEKKLQEELLKELLLPPLEI